MDQQKGLVHIVLSLLLFAIGVLAFTFISSTGYFKNGFFSTLFQKPSSQASQANIKQAESSEKVFIELK